ncbi:MAG: lipid-binding SYLF domain-containing protein [Verrucomicrobiota bacterium]
MNCIAFKWTLIRRVMAAALVAGGLAAGFGGCTSMDPDGFMPGSSEANLGGEARASLKQLYSTTPAAEALGRQARAILIFPDVLKAGFMFGGETGNGVLLEHGRVTAYYNISAASYGFQAGVQTFGYAMFFMTDSALDYLRKSGGWQVGAGPSVVVVDNGMAQSMTTTTATESVYAFIFGQQGLMGGIGLEGSKITKLQH